jgi:hypothetical protein
MIKVSIDSKKLEADLKKFTKDLNKSAEDSIKEVAQIGSRLLATKIEPFGLTGKAKDISEKAIYKDVNTAYYNIGHTYNSIKKIAGLKLANAYSGQIRDGNYAKAEQIAAKVLMNIEMQTSDDGSHLQHSRNSKGRVKQNAAPMNILDNNSLDQLAAKAVLTAGTAKAGWLQSGKSIGAKSRIPKWLNKKDMSLGSSKIVSAGWKTTVTLINHVRYAANLLNESKINTIVRNSVQNQIKKMQRIADALASKV